MSVQVRPGDYTSDGRLTSLGRGRPPSPAKAQPARPTARPADAAQVDDFLTLLGRAVQQFHTYPPTSQICQAAIDACQRALVSLEGRAELVFRVTPREVIVDEVGVGKGSIIEQELARRLHAASIAQMAIERACSARELARFCFDLTQCDARHGPPLNLIDLLEEHGVSRIALRAAYRPQVVDIDAPSAPVAQLIEQQTVRRDELFASGGPVVHLYPPDKGWVRTDPTTRFEQVSLVDLALLARDPSTLAGMLLRLTEDDLSEADGSDDALSRKFSDVTTLFAALDPRVSRIMFGKLARAVLDLQPEPRQTLLRKTILPGLLDGHIDGTVLQDFPDIDLADSLCLLLDLETAAPELVTTALARLDLSVERQAALLPLVQSRVDARAGATQDTGLDAHARKLTRVDGKRARSFADFSSFDLALDPLTVATLDGIRDSIAASDVVIVQLECLLRLIRLEPNPEKVQHFVDRSTALVEALERERRWQEIAFWLSTLRGLWKGFLESRPDVADVIATNLAGFCTVNRAARLVDLAGRDAQGHADAGAIIKSLGPDAARALLDFVRAKAGDSKDSLAAVQLLCEQATLVAPALVAALTTAGDAAVVQRTIARVLGFAGRSYETPLATLLDSRDEQTVREALRGLARIGTARAAALVSAHVGENQGWIGAAAEEALWRFPRAESDRQVRALLERREFVLRNPQAAVRLLDRAAQSGTANLEPILGTLTRLRYRFWSPALVRVARQARKLLTR